MIHWMLQYVLHRVGNSFIGFSIESIVFVIERSIQSLKRTNRVYKISTGSIRPRSIFLKDSKRSTRAIRSRSIFFKDRKDRKIEFPTLVLHNILKKNSFALFHIPQFSSLLQQIRNNFSIQFLNSYVYLVLHKQHQRSEHGTVKKIISFSTK